MGMGMGIEFLAIFTQPSSWPVESISCDVCLPEACVCLACVSKVSRLEGDLCDLILYFILCRFVRPCLTLIQF